MTYQITEAQRQQLLDSRFRRSYEAFKMLKSLTPVACIGKDPLCPCQDGDACHYKDVDETKGWPVDDEPDGDHLTIAYLDGYHKGRDAQMRELSDDELHTIYRETYDGRTGSDWKTYGRAVLKAAKETKK